MSNQKLKLTIQPKNTTPVLSIKPKTKQELKVVPKTNLKMQSKSSSDTSSQAKLKITPKSKPKSDPPLIYVLTRTSRRPYFFHQNVVSVQAQTYPNIKQIVSYDDEETEKYVKKYPSEILESYHVSKKKNSQSIDSFFPFNLYLNELIEKIPEKDHSNCWIMFLDDDDIFTRKDSVEQMVKELDTIDSDPNRILMWQVQFPSRLVPKNVPKTNRAPSPGNVSCIGFAFHISQYLEHKDVSFQPKKGGDQYFIRSIWKYVSPLWVSPKSNYLVPDELKIRFRKREAGDSSNRVTLSKKNENIKILDKKKDQVLKEKQKKTPTRYQRQKNSNDLSDDPLPSNVWTRVNYDRNRTIASGKCNDMRYDSVQSKEYKMFFQNNNTEEQPVEMNDETISSTSSSSIDSDQDPAREQRLANLLLESEDTSPSPSTSEEEISQEESDRSEQRNYYYDSQSESDEDEYEDLDENDKEYEENQEYEETEKEVVQEVNNQVRNKKVSFNHDLVKQKHITLENRKDKEVSNHNDDNDDNTEEYPECSRPLPPRPEPKPEMIDLMNSIMHRMYEIQTNMQSAMSESLGILEPENLKKIIREVIQEELPNISNLSVTDSGEKKVVRFANQPRLKRNRKQTTDPKALLQKMSQENEEDETEQKYDSEEEYDREEEEPELNSEDKKLNQLLTGYAEVECKMEEVVPEPENEEAFLLQPFQEYLNMIFILNLGGKAKELQYKFEQLGFDSNLIEIVDGNSKRSFYDNMLDLARLCKKKKYKKVAIFQDGLILHRNFTEELVLMFEQIRSLKKWKLIALTAAQNLVTKGADFNPDFYRSLYPDLEKAKLKTDQQVTRHWKSYGSREKRYPNRGIFHPDHLTGVSGVLLSAQIYSDLDKLKKAHLRMGQYMIKSYPKQLYAATPLLGLNAMNRTIRLRNKHNINLYEEA